MPANAAGLVSTNPDEMQSRTYAATSLGSMGSTSAASSQVMGGGIKPGMGISLETPPLPQDVEVTGPLAASFWVSSSTEDMDLFLTLRNFDADGNEVLETGQQGTPVPVAKGWLRVSHRELDPELSLPYRPYHKHTRRQYLTPGEIVKVDVEIWPTSMVFRRGHRIRLDIQPRDGVGSQSYMHYHADYNTGTNTIYAGGERESYSAAAGHPGEVMNSHTASSLADDIAAIACALPRRGRVGVRGLRDSRCDRRTPHPTPLPMRIGSRSRPREDGQEPRCGSAGRHDRMTTDQQSPSPPWRLFAHKNVLAGLMFMGVAALGLWISRNYPIGTALRMGTGYVPRLLCWILLGLGAVDLPAGAVRGRPRAACASPAAAARPGGR